MNHRLTLTGLVIQAGDHRLVHGIDLELVSGELLAIVGASGAGKSLIGRSLVGLVPCAPGVTHGTVTWHRSNDERVEIPPDIGPARTAGLRRIRGTGVAWIPQDARSALIPVHTVRRQVLDALRHSGRPATDDACAALLQSAGFANPALVLTRYPHTLSGGMARRVQVAVGLALGAPFLMADEPTTGLDRPVQARLMQTFAHLRDQGTGIALITHDLHLVQRHADRVMVVEAGRVVASGPPSVLQDHPHPAVARLRGAP